MMISGTQLTFWMDFFPFLFQVYTQCPANFIIISKNFENFVYFSQKNKLHDSPRSRASRFPVFLVGNSQIWINSSISWNITVDFCKVASGIYPPFDNSTIFFYSVVQSSIPFRGMFGAEKSDNIFL